MPTVHDAADFVGPWYAWWPGDPAPTFGPWPEFGVAVANDDAALGRLSGADGAELRAWRGDGNHPYLARVSGEVVACGWSATRTLAIGELGLVRSLPAGDRYLWGFVTAEAWRGQGIYPRLIAAIIDQEGAAHRYWIGHEPGHNSSSRGILKAGFRQVGEIYRRLAGDFTLIPAGAPERAGIGAAVLGATFVTDGAAGG
ncbi:MAG TPA: GNAT family N-acetyltransferase [Thermomicrobiales bacterium]